METVYNDKEKAKYNSENFDMEGFYKLKMNKFDYEIVSVDKDDENLNAAVFEVYYYRYSRQKKVDDNSTFECGNYYSKSKEVLLNIAYSIFEAKNKELDSIRQKIYNFNDYYNSYLHKNNIKPLEDGKRLENLTEELYYESEKYRNILVDIICDLRNC